MLLFSLIFVIHYFSLRQLKVCLAKFVQNTKWWNWKLDTSKTGWKRSLTARRAQQNVFSNIEKFPKKVIRNRVRVWCSGCLFQYWIIRFRCQTWNLSTQMNTQSTTRVYPGLQTHPVQAKTKLITISNSCQLGAVLHENVERTYEATRCW